MYSPAFSKNFTFFKKEIFSDDFLFLPRLPNLLNRSLCSLSAFSIDKSFVYRSQRRYLVLVCIEGNETLIKIIISII